MFMQDEDDGEKKRRIIKVDIPLPEFTGRRKRIVRTLDNLIEAMKTEEVSNLPMPPPVSLIDEIHNEILMKMATLECLQRSINRQQTNPDTEEHE